MFNEKLQKKLLHSFPNWTKKETDKSITKLNATTLAPNLAKISNLPSHKPNFSLIKFTQKTSEKTLHSALCARKQQSSLFYQTAFQNLPQTCL
jgi:hypothetical protein